MGVVYRARDLRLERFVALKLLPADRMADADRRARFIQEAKTASALNHPNIITIHDIGEQDGQTFIVMELVEGKPLHDLISPNGMRVAEALHIAIQVAGALTTAHAAGIVHRDLKPGNIMVTTQGRVKVLDFGVAKLLTPAVAAIGPDEATRALAVSGPRTGEGIVLGSFPYMSPEQAAGKPVDARSDIFSFGSLLYEMLTGQRAFEGDSNMSTMAAILIREPEPIEGIPRGLARIVQRCLRKDVDRRAQHMVDVKEELEAVSVPAAPAVVRLTGRGVVWAPVLAVVVALASVAFWFVRRDGTAPLALLGTPLTSYTGQEDSPAFSPDGNQVAFSWDGETGENQDIYVKLAGPGSPLRLTTGPAVDRAPAWSPDGRSIAFVRDHIGRKSEVLLVSPLGGPERQITEISSEAARLSWSPNGRWVVVSGARTVGNIPVVLLVSTETGETRQLTFPPQTASERGDQAGRISPDGRTLAFVRMVGSTAGDIYLLALDDAFQPKGEPRRLTHDSRYILGLAWTADGREIVFSSNRGSLRTLWRVAVAGGEPRQMAIGEHAQNPDVSAKGNRLAYSRSSRDDNIWRVSLTDPKEPAALFISSTRRDFSPQYSPDGRRIAFVSDRSGNEEVWMCDADGSNPVQVVSTGRSGAPRWSPDTEQIVFGSTVDSHPQIFTVRAKGGPPRRITNSPGNDSVPSWSHDGKWIYFASNRSGSLQIWKVPSERGDPVQITKSGGFEPLESGDGQTIFYTKQSATGPLWKVPAGGGEETQVLESVNFRGFAVSGGGIYFARGHELRYLNLTTGKSGFLRTTPKPAARGFSVSPDRRWLLYTHLDAEGSDIMLIEDFR